MRHDSHVLRVTRSLRCAASAFVLAVAIGLASSIGAPAPASAMSDANTPAPSPLSVLATPFTVGMHVIEAIAQGIANAVEMLATPAPIAIPAPGTHI